MPSHAHNRGTMNITGYFPTVDMGGREDPWGAFYIDSFPGANPRVGNDGYDEYIIFDASRSWTGVTSYEGGNQAHENRPPYYALYYIMKL